ncbi:hypothetical protein COCNU_10G002690 [Cocos nucifera]|uniref:Uncharacterized protein n=1 Tax=Cocos nucifera TaxID=13894 RepID=A0A8K0N7H0_COCNU|nr:hypothetical protein COCNU_10G002690 [Cocos nucifera]
MSGKEKPMVVEISSSSEEEEETKRNKSEAEKGRRKYSVVEVKTEDEHGEEEDCYILPFDPLADDLNQKLSLCAAPSQLDELSIVAERGQVACRDYPHSRHLCAEYPFSMTSHESCCLKCYCYVCDEAAPCKFWKEPNGHCHASDEDKKWKEMRKRRGQKKGTLFDN